MTAVTPAPTDFAPPPRFTIRQKVLLGLVFFITFASGMAVGEQESGSATLGGGLDAACQKALDYMADSVYVLGNLAIALEARDQDGIRLGEAEVDRINSDLDGQQAYQECMTDRSAR